MLLVYIFTHYSMYLINKWSGLNILYLETKGVYISTICLRSLDLSLRKLLKTNQQYSTGSPKSNTVSAFIFMAPMQVRTAALNWTGMWGPLVTWVNCSVYRPYSSIIFIWPYLNRRENPTLQAIDRNGTKYSKYGAYVVTVRKMAGIKIARTHISPQNLIVHVRAVALIDGLFIRMAGWRSRAVDRS